MELRLADKSDLHNLKSMYKEIIDNMKRNEIDIWDEIYPCEFFKEDIQKRRLYLITDGDEIAAAFAMSESNVGEKYVKWNNKDEKACYIDRLGVNLKFQRKGIGGLAVKNALEIGKQKGAKYLRLFVVDINKPAIDFYLKNGFVQAEGMYQEEIDDFILCEYGFERKIL